MARGGGQDVGARRRGAAALLALTTAMVLGLVWLLPRDIGAGRWPGQAWEAVVCDVGQGESVLVRVGPSSAVVVDTGPEPHLVDGCLRRAGVTSVPLLVLTHLHVDHVGGLSGVTAAAEVGAVWAASSGMPRQAAAELRAWAATQQVPLRHPARGTTAQVGDVRLDVLSPAAPGGSSSAAVGDSQDVNDAGLVVRLDTGELTLLAVGDIGSQVQQRLLGSGVDLRADVTTVAHHGSADQLPAFYAAVGARVAVASAGRDNSYGHPSPRAAEVVSSTGTLVLATATHGDVALRAVGAAGAGGGATDQGPVAVVSVAVRTTRAGPRRRPPVPA